MASDIQQRLPDICLGLLPQRLSEQDSNGDCVFRSLGLTQERIGSIMRISIGWTTTEEELQRAAYRIADAYESLRDNK
jgi:cysteine sulfinate desulfinase/cysteine desulfurase-like protein